MKPVTLLIDGDILVWRASAAAQVEVDWGQNIYSMSANLKEAIGRLESDVRWLVSRLKATEILVALSDPVKNWRKGVLDTYKANRGTRSKPLVFWQLREHLEQTYRTESFPGLEGDDVMALYATGSSIKGRKVVVSIDKDLRTVPCWLFNPNTPDSGPRRVTEAEADRAHLTQALTGDPTDGYAGCPGVGPVKAARVLTGLSGLDAWRAIVACYGARGLTEQDALVQARVARILRRGEYNRKTGEVKLWTPRALSMSPETIAATTTPRRTRAAGKSSRPGASGTTRRARAGTT